MQRSQAPSPRRRSRQALTVLAVVAVSGLALPSPQAPGDPSAVFVILPREAGNTWTGSSWMGNSWTGNSWTGDSVSSAEW